MPLPKSSRKYLHTYRSAAKDYLRQFPAPRALEEVVNQVLCQLYLHGLHGRREVLGPHVAVRSPNEGNPPGGKLSGRHDGRSGEISM